MSYPKIEPREGWKYRLVYDQPERVSVMKDKGWSIPDLSKHPNLTRKHMCKGNSILMVKEEKKSV